MSRFGSSVSLQLSKHAECDHAIKSIGSASEYSNDTTVGMRSLTLLASSPQTGQGDGRYGTNSKGLNASDALMVARVRLPITS
jgi:hypothetical protein